MNYFLIVWDFIHWAKQNGIPVGPGPRLGGWLDGRVCDGHHGHRPDPLQTSVRAVPESRARFARRTSTWIFARTGAARSSNTCGKNTAKLRGRAVSQIATFGTLGAKSVVRDVGRVHRLELRRGGSHREDDPERPRNLDITLNGIDKKNKETGAMEHVPGAIDKNPDLKKAVETEPATDSSGNTRMCWRASSETPASTRRE